jgi:hypothetical protein
MKKILAILLVISLSFSQNPSILTSRVFCGGDCKKPSYETPEPSPEPTLYGRVQPSIDAQNLEHVQLIAGWDLGLQNQESQNMKENHKTRLPKPRKGFSLEENLL